MDLAPPKRLITAGYRCLIGWKCALVEGDVLGCGAYCESLRRTHVAGLSVMDAVVPEDVPARGAVDLQAALAPMPARQISAAALEDIAHGRPIAALDGPLGPVALVHDGQVAAIAALDGAGHLRPRVVLA